MGVSSDVALWASIVGFLAPLVTAMIIRRGWTAATQAIANFAVAFVGTLGTQYFEGNLDTSNVDGFIRTFMIVFVASIASYHGLLRPTNVAPKLEAVTGGDPAPVTGSAPPFGTVTDQDVAA
jgi:hypothetical protein